MRSSQIVVLLFATHLAMADEATTVSGLNKKVEPDIKVQADDLNTEFFELGVFTGLLYIEDFNTEIVYGINATFHATEDLFLQFNYGQAHAGITACEKSSCQKFLDDSDRDYRYFDFLVGYNIFPGEVFSSSNEAHNSAFYLVAGVGNTDFGGEINFTFTFGVGYKVILRDRITWHVNYRDHAYESDLLRENETVHNIELSMGVTFFF